MVGLLKQSMCRTFPSTGRGNSLTGNDFEVIGSWRGAREETAAAPADRRSAGIPEGGYSIAKIAKIAKIANIKIPAPGPDALRPGEFLERDASGG